MASGPPFSFESTTNSELEIARMHVRQGNLAEAERAYRQVAATQPDQVEALRFFANAALSRGNPGEAVAMLSRAAQVDRSNTGVLLELGLAYRSAQRLDEARSVFELVLESSKGRNTTARLLMANVLEEDKRPEQALLHYFRAIIDAQSEGQWLNDATTEPGLRRLVQHAMQYVSTERRKLFEGVLEPLRHGIDAARLGRVDTALAVYLRDRVEASADPRQKTTFLYIPDLGTQCFLDTTSLDWLPRWSARVCSLNNEAQACLEILTKNHDSSPFSLASMTAGGGTDAALPMVRQVPVYQRGIFVDAIRGHAPGLIETLDAAPLARIPNYAPDVSILALQPGARTTPRYGRTNAFCTIVAAFSGSAPIEVTVGGDPRRLQANESLAFDPSFEFEFSATVDSPALVLVLDVWNPGVSTLERNALIALTTAAVNFDARLQDLA